MPDLLLVYVDDEGELHITKDRRKWDGKAFFLGYTTINIVDIIGDTVPMTELEKRLRGA